MRVATWNLERRATPDRLELAQTQDLDLLLAQEVTSAAYEDLRRSGLFDWSAFSLDHRPRLARGSRSERLGVAVFGRRPIHLRASGILPWLMRPEKFVLADLELPGWRERVSVASYHASPGDGKPECSLQVAHWLELQFGPTILGLDANSPDVDHPDHEQSVFHWQHPPFTHCEPALIGPPSKRRHRLEDAHRLWLARHPDEFQRLVSARPNGPLACTYDRMRDDVGFKPSRFDSVWVSSEFRVDRVDHLWDDASSRPMGGSDHAMVVVDLQRTPSRPRSPRQRVLDHIIDAGLLDDGTELHFNIDLVTDYTARAVIQSWIDGEHGRSVARFLNDRTRPLEWVAGGGTYSLTGLAAHICASAGVEFLGEPPGPHWWRAVDGRTLVALSDGV